MAFLNRGRRPFWQWLLLASIVIGCIILGSPLPDSAGMAKVKGPTVDEPSAEYGSSAERRNRFEEITGTPDLDSEAATELEAATDNQYILEFNRSPIVGSRLRLEGIYNESRLRFTRPRNWQLKSVKILLRYRHSSALYATRSNLNVLVNGSNIGSVPLNHKQGEIGTVTFDIPTRVVQDYNELIIAGLQNNSPTCTQDPFDPSLWTEILPDSKLVFDFDPQPFVLDFKSYPYPLLDILSLEPNQITYLQPQRSDANWLTAAARFQTSLGRIADYRPLDLSLIKRLDQVQASQRLVVIGTPEQQPQLAELTLPLTLREGQFRDRQQQVIAPETGILMWTALPESQSPVLVATGNSPAAVSKAVQFLVQSQDRKIGTGQVILVDQIETLSTPALRDWPRYLPLSNDFDLGDLKTFTGEPIEDVTIRGAHAPPFVFDFRALPDDQFKPGNVMTLKYTYGPQVNPLTSLVEVQLDGITLAGRRLNSIEGGRHETLKVELPENHITPHSQLQVFLRFDPRERRSCSRVTDHQLWGTIHSDTHFKLYREQVAKLPNLKLLQAGYPFVAPQDLSRTAIVLANRPSSQDIQLLLLLSERLGRLSRAESVELQVYPVSQLPETVRAERHLIGIGLRSHFPFPEAFESNAFSLQSTFFRQWGDSRIQTLPDADGLMQQQISPWNAQRVLLSLTSQSSTGLQQVGDLLDLDSLFSQLEGDTALISANESNTSAYDENAYNLEFLSETRQREIHEENRVSRTLTLLKGNWYILVPGMIVLTLIIYGVTQSYLRRLTPVDEIHPSQSAARPPQ